MRRNLAAGGGGRCRRSPSVVRTGAAMALAASGGRTSPAATQWGSCWGSNTLACGRNLPVALHVEELLRRVRSVLLAVHCDPIVHADRSSRGLDVEPSR